MKFQMCLILFSLAMALDVSAAPPQTDAQRAVTLCKGKYAQETPTQALDMRMCLIEQNILIIARRMDAGEQGLADQVRELRAQLSAAKAELPQAPSGSAPAATNGASAESAQQQIARRVSQLGRPDAVSTQQRPPAARTEPSQSLPPNPLPLAPPPSSFPLPRFRIVDTPGQQAATTYQVGGDWLNVEDLEGGVDKFAWGVPLENIRVLVFKDKKDIAILHTKPEQLSTTAVEESFGIITADLNRDGLPDGKLYSSLDPSIYDSFWVSSVGPDDSVEMIFLFKTGKSVEAPGLGIVPLWGRPLRIVLSDASHNQTTAYGKWRMSAHNGLAR